MSNSWTCCPPSRAVRIGAALLDAVAERARAAGLDGLSLSTFREAPWNAPYYRRLGFVEVAGGADAGDVGDPGGAHRARAG
jgi:GNAT superfamily N-acetyltransferase